jgi:hypothetical protein
MMMADLFQLEWPVDQHGYTVLRGPFHDPDGYGDGEFEFIRALGGPPRYYRPLDDGALWARFADQCRAPEGVLHFVSEYGTLRQQEDNVDHYLRVAKRLWAVAEYLEAGDRLSAASILLERRMEALPYPHMTEMILWSPDRPEIFELAVRPDMLEDALRHQAAEAITGNRQFRRCRNQGCANWFRLGPRAAGEGGRTYTARREFCSDRCRVAWARRHKREAAAHA